MRVIRIPNRLPLLPLLPLLLLATPAPSSAQDVKYTSVTRGEFGGALGRVLNLIGGSKDVTEVTSIKGPKLRTDTDQSSTILDIQGRSFTWIDHESKTYTTMTFQQAVDRANAMVQEAHDSLEAAKAQMKESPEAKNPTYRYEVHFSTDRPGKTAKIAGYDAEQMFLTVSIDAIPIRQPDETEAEAQARAGTLVLLSEMWMSTTFPGYTARQAQAKMWAEALQSTEIPSKEMAQAYNFDPRIKQGFEKLAEETKGLEGEALRSVIHVVVVPYGVTFDREQVLKDANKKLTDDMGDVAANEAKKSAEGAVSGLTGGLFGKKKKPAEPATPQPKQATIMRVKSEVKDCSTAPLAASVFQPPAGYTERPLQ
jgi:hypothetical protein